MLLDNQLKYLSVSLEESKKREIVLQDELKEQKDAYVVKIKDKDQQYQVQIKQIQDRLDIYTDKCNEVESELEKTNQILAAEKNSKIEIDDKLNKDIINNLNKQIDDFKEVLKNNDKTRQIQIDELTKSKTDLEKVIEKLEKEKSDQKCYFENEITTLNQKLQLNETQMSHIKASQAESQKSHETLLKVLKTLEAKEDSPHDDISEIVQKQKYEQLEEIKKLEEQFTATKQRLIEQVDTLTFQKNDLELKLKLLKNDFKNEFDILTKQNSDLTLQLENSALKMNEQENQRTQLIKSLELGYKRKIADLEANIANIEELNKNAIDDFRKEKQNDFLSYTTGTLSF